MITWLIRLSTSFSQTKSEVYKMTPKVGLSSLSAPEEFAKNRKGRADTHSQVILKCERQERKQVLVWQVSWLGDDFVHGGPYPLLPCWVRITWVLKHRQWPSEHRHMSTVDMNRSPNPHWHVLEHNFCCSSLPSIKVRISRSSERFPLVWNIHVIVRSFCKLVFF